MFSDQVGLGLFKEFNMTGTHQLNGLLHFLSPQAYRCKNPGDPLIMIFSIFPRGKFAQLGTFSVVEDWNLFSGIIFFPRDWNHLF